MAIKAGLVGVNPKGVDKNGMPIGSGGANVEAEIQQINLDIAQLQASKVGIGQLTANNKAFNFAYDSTTEKYGYKLDGTGDFIPFESAGGGSGWVAPADLITTGITYTRCSHVSGGYVVIDDMVYVDIIIQRTSTSAASIAGLPLCKNVGAYILVAKDITSDKYDVYEGNAALSTGITSDHTVIAMGNGTADGVYHVWGQYLIATT